MKRLLLVFFCLVVAAGCENLSPRDNLSPKNDVYNKGYIEKLEQSNNLLRAEIEKLSLINKENNNFGIQILQGDGGLIFLFGLLTNFLILFYFYKTAESYRKSAELMAGQIREKEIHEDVIQAAKNTEVEKEILKLLEK